MSEPKFKVGDVVQHKASGEKGVVTKIWESCSVHNGWLGCNRRIKKCRFEFNGFYSIVDSFGAPHNTVREIEIEPSSNKDRQSQEEKAAIAYHGLMGN